jgi:hypothetical protein
MATTDFIVSKSLTVSVLTIYHGHTKICSFVNYLCEWPMCLSLDRPSIWYLVGDVVGKGRGMQRRFDNGSQITCDLMLLDAMIAVQIFIHKAYRVSLLSFEAAFQAPATTASPS